MRHTVAGVCSEGVRAHGDRRPGKRAVTAVRSPVPVVPSSAPPPGPTPRRVRPPGWLDLRLVLGVLLVLGPGLLGARAVGGAAPPVPAWPVTADWAPGTSL